jgi:hypothetical protein
MLFRDTLAVYCENHTEHINTFCGQNTEIITLKHNNTGIWRNIRAFLNPVFCSFFNNTSYDWALMREIDLITTHIFINILIFYSFLWIYLLTCFFPVFSFYVYFLCLGFLFDLYSIICFSTVSSVISSKFFFWFYLSCVRLFLTDCIFTSLLISSFSMWWRISYIHSFHSFINDSTALCWAVASSSVS